MYIRSLSIENFRCFKKAEMDFLHPHRRDTDWPSDGTPSFPKIRNVNLLLGDNGAGKTSVLRAVAVGLLGAILDSSGFRPYYLVRRRFPTASKAQFANITADAVVHKQDSNIGTDEANEIMGPLEPTFFHTQLKLQGDVEQITNRTTLVSGSVNLEGFFWDNSPAFLVLAYGATRRSEQDQAFSPLRDKDRNLRYQRVAGLFEEHFNLVPLNYWLPTYESQEPQRFKEIQHIFNQLLPEGVRLMRRFPRPPFANMTNKTSSSPERPVHDGYAFVFGRHAQRNEIPFTALSDGYRAFAGWIGDMLYHLVQACPPHLKLTDLRGVVMVDEVDLHLHPEWQRTVVGKLSETFPRLQFIFTSHSPLVAGTLEAGNIWVMEQEKSGVVVPHRYNESIYGLSADQILTSSYFGLTTPRAPGAETHLHKLAQQARKGDADASLRYLEAITSGVDVDEAQGAAKNGSNKRKSSEVGENAT